MRGTNVPYPNALHGPKGIKSLKVDPGSGWDTERVGPAPPPRPLSRDKGGLYARKEKAHSCECALSFVRRLRVRKHVDVCATL
jgi:hypothetical protein